RVRDVLYCSRSDVDAANDKMYDEFNMSLDHRITKVYCTCNYRLINLSNNVLAAADSIEEITDLTVINIGEARFLRGWAYFNLVRTCGDVPLIDFRITDQASSIRPKSTIAEIYQLIDEDVKAAIPALLEVW